MHVSVRRLVRTDIPGVRGQVPPTPQTLLSRVSQIAAAMTDQRSGYDRGGTEEQPPYLNE